VEQTTLLPKVEQPELKFNYLPAYARFILEENLEEYVRTQLSLSRALNLPILKYFQNFAEEEIIRISEGTSSEFLSYIANNQVNEQVKESIRKWKNDELPVIGKFQVTIQDVTVLSYIRRKTLLNLIPLYTLDFLQGLSIVNELEEYFMFSDRKAFDAYADILKEQIQQKEEQLLQAQEIAGMGSYLWNLSTLEGNVTPQLVKLLDLRPEDHLKTFLSKIHPDDRERFQESLRIAKEKNSDFDCEYRYFAHGEEKMMWSRGSVTMEKGQPILKGTVMDITSRSRMLQQLKESEKLYKQAQERAHIGNFVWDLQTNDVLWSDELYRIYNLDPEAEKITFDKYSSMLSIEGRELLLEEIEKATQTNSIIDFNFKINLEDGIQKVVNIKAEVVKNAAGDPVKIVGTNQDITTQMEYENTLQQKNRLLQQSNANLEEFAYVASHDMKEPLRKISTFGEMLSSFTKDSLTPQANMYVQKMIEGGKRMQKMIDDLLALSVISHNRSFENTDLQQTLSKVLVDLELKIKEKNAVITSDKLPIARVVPSQFEQLFLNIIGNSLKFSRKDVDPIIDISHKQLNPKEVKKYGLTPGFDYLLISIRDNGIGFEEEYQDKIFGMFQRLHGKVDYEGSGIGLAICKKIAEHHGGLIEATGKENEGAEFRVIIRLQ
jgi:PAS domain S-box-containing protein